MILKGSQRGGPRQLAVHLMNQLDNDHVTLSQVQGFVAGDLYGAMAEAQGIARGTRCRQCVFSLSLNPPKDKDVSPEQLMAAIERAEEALGLSGQPRAIVIHEKSGRRHAHAVWSRIDAATMKAVNLPFFKNKLTDLSRELYLEHGWELPDGLKTNGWKNPLNFTLAEWQQARRLGMDPREIKQIFQEAWARSDDRRSFTSALEEHGYYLARGDRRGFVAVDLQGEVYSLSRWAGVKTKDLAARLGDEKSLPGVDDVKAGNEKNVSKRLRGVLTQDREEKQKQLAPLLDEARRMTKAHRAERARLHQKQEQRRLKENRARAGKFRKGIGLLFDLLTGRLFRLRRENEREAFEGYRRDQAQRNRLCGDQLKERAALQSRINAMKARQARERRMLARRIADVLQITRDYEAAAPARSRDRPGEESQLRLH